MRAFIVRPFGTKTTKSGLEIDFDAIEENLIGPALAVTGYAGRTTVEIVSQGNIREDMFQRLLTADLVIADITVHNANVFFELGIRFALREKRTILLRGQSRREQATDEVPFDLKTDRYLTYDVQNPNEALDALTSTITASQRSEKADSPVFQLLKELKPAHPEAFLIAPRDFRETVALCAREGWTADLALLSLELATFKPDWGRLGQRLVAESLFQSKAFEQAVGAWERLREFDPFDVAANFRLGTCYAKLGRLSESDLALDRMDDEGELDPNLEAERLALVASNAKTRWIMEWSGLGANEGDNLELRQTAALDSPHLELAADFYENAFERDLNHYYSGINALALRKIQLQLAEALPELWQDLKDEASSDVIAKSDLEKKCAGLEAAVEWSVKANRARAKPNDPWAKITDADFQVLVSDNPRLVARKYRNALANQSAQAHDSTLRQLKIYTSLGLFGNVAIAAEEIVTQGASAPKKEERGLVFTGHRVDTPDRKMPRFPNTESAIDRARSMIRNALEEEIKKDGTIVAFAGGASGGDLLFHEICQKLGIQSWLLLAMPREPYLEASVNDGGDAWIDLFIETYAAREEKGHIRVLQNSQNLPDWLSDERAYSIWQRNNLWTLSFGLQFPPARSRLLALWNGEPGDDLGGTQDMVELARKHGMGVTKLEAATLLQEK